MTRPGRAGGSRALLDAALGARRHRRHADRVRLPARRCVAGRRRRRAPRPGAGRLGRRRARDGRVRIRTAAERPLLRARVRLRGARAALAAAARAARAHAAARVAARPLRRLAGVGQPAQRRRRAGAFAAIVATREAVRRRAPAPRRGRARARRTGRSRTRDSSSSCRSTSSTRRTIRTATCRRRPPCARSRSARQIRPRFYVGPLASDLTARREVELGDLGRTRSSRARRARRRDRARARGDRAVVSTDRYAAERRQGEASRRARRTSGAGRAAAGRIRAARRAAFLVDRREARARRARLELGCGTGEFTERSSSPAASSSPSTSARRPPALPRARRRPRRGRRREHRDRRRARRARVRRDRRRQVLHHVDLDACLAHTFPLLRPGGRFAFSEPNMREPAGVGRAQLRAGAPARHVTAARDRVSRRKSSAARFEDAGLVVDVVRAVRVPAPEHARAGSSRPRSRSSAVSRRRPLRGDRRLAPARRPPPLGERRRMSAARSGRRCRKTTSRCPARRARRAAAQEPERGVRDVVEVGDRGDDTPTTSVTAPTQPSRGEARQITRASARPLPVERSVGQREQAELDHARARRRRRSSRRSRRRPSTRSPRSLVERQRHQHASPARIPSAPARRTGTSRCARA